MVRGSNIPSTPPTADAAAALDWWLTQQGTARGRIADCRMAAEYVADAGAVGLLVARVNRDLARAEALLDNPDALMGDDWGELAPEVALEDASRIIARARRLLKAAASRTRSVRDLLRIGVALRRVESLAARIVHGTPNRLALTRWRAPAPTSNASPVALVATRPVHGPPAPTL